MISLKAVRIGIFLIAALIVSGVAERLHVGGAVSRLALPEGQHRLVTPTVPSQAPERPFNKYSLLGAVSATFAATSATDTSDDAKGTAAADNSKRPGAVGGPFVLPDSIVAACDDRGIKSAHLCDRLYADIARMAKDPRDAVWASAMEEKLQAYIEQAFKEASIRNIECRTSWCAIEVATTDAKIGAAFPYPNPLNDQLARDAVMSSLRGGGDPEIFVVVYRRK